MDGAFLSCALSGRVLARLDFVVHSSSNSNSTRRRRRTSPIPKNIRYPRRTQLPPDFGVNLFLKNPTIPPQAELQFDDEPTSIGNDPEEEEGVQEDGVIWDSDEVEAISSLFQGRMPQKPGNLSRKRPLPLSLPHKLRPLGLPTPKRHLKSAHPQTFYSRASLSNQLYKNPRFLIGLAREIGGLKPHEHVSSILSKQTRFLRKGSLSLTIKELGYMGFPERALQTFCWAQKQPHLFPDDRILASTIQILAGNHELRLPFDFLKFTGLASKTVMEALLRGFIKAGNLKLGKELLLVARDSKRMLDSGLYAKLMLKLGQKMDNPRQVLHLLDELGEREELNLRQQDCTAVMKVCIKLGKFELVESLFDWFKHSGREPSVVMYTTLIYSHYLEKRFRQALAVVWEMESLNCLFDLPAYCVVIKFFVALNDLSRTTRYFSRLKEAGFSPTYDIFRDMYKIYMDNGRVAKSKELCKEAEAAGFELDKL